MSATASGTPVLIIQGFLAPTLTNFILKTRLRGAGFLAEDVPLEGLNGGDIRDSARIVEMSVNAMRARAGTQKVDIIGISMGGLIGLYYLRKLGGDAYVRRFVSIGAPFNGTPFAYIMQALTFGKAPGAGQMIPGSELLTELGDSSFKHSAEMYSFHASADAFVSENAARLEGATMIKSENGFWPAGHYTPLFLKQDFTLIKDILLK